MTDPITYPMTDAGNGSRLANLFSDSLKWVSDWKCWVVYDGMRFARQSDDILAEGKAKLAALAMTEEAGRIVDDNQRQAFLRHAAKSMDMPKLRAAVAAAKSIPKMRITAEQFDRNEFLLNVKNGTIDLRTGAMHPHEPRNLITRLVPQNYIPGAYSPLWESLVRRATQVDPTGQSAEFLKMVMGYQLVGGNPEHQMFFLIGPGGTGKSQVVEIPVAVLGTEYAWSSKPSVITKGKGDVHTEQLSILEHKRFVSISETDGSMRLDESAFKQITGARSLPMRNLYGPERLADIEATFIVGTNELPTIENFDEAIRRRVTIIESGPPLLPEEKDIYLAKKIVENEAEGVLASLVHGAKRWYGLSQGHFDSEARTDGAVFSRYAPDAVARATLNFAHDSDPIIEFIEEALDFGEGYRVSATAVNQAYNDSIGHAQGVRKRRLYERILAIAAERQLPVHKDARDFHGMRIRIDVGASVNPFEGRF
jgi:putative DNA primase/helicase